MAVHCLLLLSSIQYFAVFLCSLSITIAIAVVTSNLNYHCLLFVDDLTKPWSQVATSPICHFCMYLPVGTGIYAFAMGVYNGYATLVAFRETHIARLMWVMPWMLINSLVFLVTFAAATAFSIGFTISCNTLEKESGGCEFQFNNRWTNTPKAYNLYNVIQIASWVSFILWTGIFVLTVLRYLRNRKARSNNPFLPFGEPADTQPISTFPPTA